jgi:hypothetical protein
LTHFIDLRNLFSILIILELAAESILSDFAMEVVAILFVDELFSRSVFLGHFFEARECAFKFVYVFDHEVLLVM